MVASCVPAQPCSPPTIVQCLTVEDLKDLIKFAYEEKVVLLADEVYQPNIYQASGSGSSGAGWGW